MLSRISTMEPTYKLFYCSYLVFYCCLETGGISRCVGPLIAGLRDILQSWLMSSLTLPVVVS